MSRQPEYRTNDWYLLVCVAESQPSAPMCHCDDSRATVPCPHCLMTGLRLLPPPNRLLAAFSEEPFPPLPGNSLYAHSTVHSAHLARPPHPHAAEIGPPRNACSAGRPRPAAELRAHARVNLKSLSLSLRAQPAQRAASPRQRLY